MTKFLRSFIVVPLALAAAVFLWRHFELQGRPLAFVWGTAGAITGGAFRIFFRSVRNYTPNGSIEAKYFSEQLKLFSSLLNTIGIAFFIGALARPVIERNPELLDIKISLVLGSIGFAFHYLAQRVLSYWKDDSASLGRQPNEKSRE